MPPLADKLEGPAEVFQAALVVPRFAWNDPVSRNAPGSHVPRWNAIRGRSTVDNEHYAIPRLRQIGSAVTDRSIYPPQLARLHGNAVATKDVAKVITLVVKLNQEPDRLMH